MVAHFVLVLCLSLVSSWAKKTTCPSAEDIKPCVCSVASDPRVQPSITCESVLSVESLRKAATGMTGHSITTFSLSNSNIGVLPADIFSDLEIRILSIKYTNLSSLSESINRPPFLGLENSLEYLSIKDSFLNEQTPLTRLSLSHLKKLYSLTLEGNILPIIGNDWFESGPYNLKDLNLLDTRANTLGSHAFVYMKQLRQLSLTGSHLSSISRKVFPQPSLVLEVLDLSNNRFQTLPRDLFSKMPSLHQVFLANNDLVSVPETVFAPVWSQLKIVNFYGNPLNCDASMKWIYKYRLPESMHGYCVLPDKLRYKTLSNLTLADFGN